MASVVYENPFAFSKTGKLFALCGSDGKLKIWDTGTGLLKQEYTKNLHLSSPCSCLTWLQTSKSKSHKRLRTSVAQVTGDLEDVIAVGTSSGTVMLYSVNSNSIISEVAGHTSKVNCLSCANNDLYSCSDDHYIVEWDLSKHKVKSKWKDGKTKVKCILAMSCGKKILSASSSIKLWNLENHEVIRNFVGHSSEVFMLLEVPKKDSYFISAAKGDRIINAWSTSGLEESNCALAGFVVQDNVVSLHLSSPSTLCAVSQTGMLHVFQYKLNGTVSKPLKPKLVVTLVSGTVDKGSQSPVPIHSVLSVEESSALIAYGSPTFLLFETLALSEFKDEKVVLVRDTNRRHEQDPINSRTRAPDLHGDVQYLIPGDTLMTPRKGRHQDVPLERRLENLELAAPDVGHQPRKDNMAQLLVQGLQSRDRDVIHDVLLRKEESIINTTVKHLPVQALLPLVKELTTLMQGKTFTSRVAVLWLTAVLRLHAAVLLANPDLHSLVQPLLTAVETKVSGLPALLRLRGRLSLVSEQIANCMQGVDETSTEPLITYQDRNQSDSGSDSEQEGDSAEEWDEFSSMEGSDG